MCLHDFDCDTHPRDEVGRVLDRILGASLKRTGPVKLLQPLAGRYGAAAQLDKAFASAGEPA